LLGRADAPNSTAISPPLTAESHKLLRGSLQEEGDPDGKVMVNFIAIIVRRSGAMSVQPC
jgi:hypothetical protein